MFKSQAIKRLEEKIYSKIAAEIQSGEIEQGTWAKGLAEANGDKEKAEARYIQLRFKKIKEKSIADYNRKMSDEYQKEEQTEQEQSEVKVTKKPPLYRRFLALLISLIIIGLMAPLMSVVTFIGVIIFRPESSSSFANVEAGGSILGFLLSALLATYAYRKISGYSKDSLKSFRLTR